MSLNKKLSKEAQFAYHIFHLAAQGSVKDQAYLNDTNLIIAGGAIRDLYFNRPANRDIDLYFDGSKIGHDQFAYHLTNTIDFDQIARDFGFERASLVRRSTSEAMFFPGSNAAMANPHQYLQSKSRRGHSGSGSKQDSTGMSHPLRSVEEFTLTVDGRYTFDIELMNVSMNPIEYVMTNFAIKLSRCYYDGKAVHYTSDFFTDAKNKTLTIACQIEHARFERLFSYYLPKMKHYFPDFSVRVDLDAMNSGSPF